MDKNRNIELLKAKLTLMANFAEEARKIGDEIADMFDEQDDALWDILNEVQDCERPMEEIDGTIQELKDYGLLNDWEQGKPVTPASVSFGHNRGLSVKIESNGGELLSYVDISDGNTVQAGVIYYADDGNPLLGMPTDICMVEVKDGELAKVHNLPENNKDLDVYVWSDPYSEDYTNSFRVSNEDVLKSLNSLEE